MTSPTTALPAPGDPEVVYVVDFSGYSRRMWEGMKRNASAPHMRLSPDGIAVGHASALMQWFVGVLRTQRPAYLVVVLDDPGRDNPGSTPGWRKALFPDYKAKRSGRDPELIAQENIVIELLQLHGIPVLWAYGYEADDLAATISKCARRLGLRVLVTARDKDLLQLTTDPMVSVWDGYEPTVATAASVQADVEKWHGCGPSHIADFLALAGDGSDGIKGVPNIGKQRAAELLLRWGTLEDVLTKAPAAMKASVTRDNLVAHADEARLYRRLTGLCEQSPVWFDPSQAIVGWSAEAADAINARYQDLDMTWSPSVSAFPKRTPPRAVMGTYKLIMSGVALTPVVIEPAPIVAAVAPAVELADADDYAPTTEAPEQPEPDATSAAPTEATPGPEASPPPVDAAPLPEPVAAPPAAPVAPVVAKPAPVLLKAPVPLAAPSTEPARKPIQGKLFGF